MFPLPIVLAHPAKRWLYYFAVPAALLVWLLPVGAVVLTAARSADDLMRGEIWTWPRGLHFVENLEAVFALSNLGAFLLNSAVIALCAVSGALVLSSMAGYALAKLRIPGSNIILAIFIAGNLTPFQALMIPVRDLMVGVGLYDTRLGLILFHASFQTGFATLFMRNFIRQIPDSVIEAARLDGATELQIFGGVVLPLIRPAIAGVSVLLFTFVWNDYFWSLVLVNSDAVRPVTAGLQTLRGMFQTSWNLVSAASLLAALPPVLLFFLMQKEFVAGLTYGVSGE